MKKVLLLATGGTIAAAKTDEGMNPQLTPEDLVAYIPEVADICQIDCKTILNVDSTNVQPEDWQLMAKECYAALPYYDGFVISHGTDTLSYSATALSFMLQNPGKPVVLTGSQMSISDPEGDARKNLLDAFITAASDLAGVYVTFYGKVMLGSHTVKIRTQSFDAFESVNAPLVGRIENNKLEILSDLKYERQVGGTNPKLAAGLDPRVFVIKLIPGFDPEWLRELVKLDIHGIVIEAFCLGGLPFKGRDLLSAVNDLVDQGIPVVMSTQVPFETTDLTIYEVGIKALKAGVIPTGVMTSVAVVTKLMWALGQTKDLEEIREIMMQDIALETKDR